MIGTAPRDSLPLAKACQLQFYYIIQPKNTTRLINEKAQIESILLNNHNIMLYSIIYSIVKCAANNAVYRTI